MDSDSSSDDSHVSATPPRDRLRSPAKAEKLNPRRIPVKSELSSNAEVPISSSSKSKQQISEPADESSPPFVLHLEPFPLPGTSLLIRNPNDRADTSNHSENSLPAGFFSKAVSFSNRRREIPISDFSLESVGLPSTTIRDSEMIGEDQSQKSTAKQSDSRKFARKHFNLVGGDLQITPMKRKEGIGGGNFVKYNMKGYKQKGKRRRSFKHKRGYGLHRSRKRGEARDAEEESRDDVKSGGTNSESELIEEAISAVRNEVSDKNLLRLLKLVYGFDSYREGQLDSIKMVLSGESTMLVLPTGAGKSLCYHIPALVLQGLVLVVSPLISLMIDQLKQLPPSIRGGFLSGGQTVEESGEVFKFLEDGTMKVLYVSPERFLNVEFVQLFSDSSNLVVSLVVVDEAHCLVEWSHNFRPSYMRLSSSLFQSTLNTTRVLAMTATATRKTLQSVMSSLGIPPSNLIHCKALRLNLQLSVDISANRIKDLLTLLKHPPYSEIHSIIVYCKFQSETEALSKNIRDANISAKCYHGGLPAEKRAWIQSLFCSNKIKVVRRDLCPFKIRSSNRLSFRSFPRSSRRRLLEWDSTRRTSARCVLLPQPPRIIESLSPNRFALQVIHYSLPESLEEYVQEIGRAGRDGNVSHCHLLIDESAYSKLRSLAFSNGVDRHSVGQFLGEVFSGPVHNIRSLVKDTASRKFDMKDEVMLTLLTYMELGDVQYLRLLPQLNVTCTVNFHMTKPAKLSETDDVVAAVVKRSKMKNGQFVFDVVTLSNELRIPPDHLLSRLYSLKLEREITYEMKDPAYCYTLVDVPKDLPSLASDLVRRLSDVEKCQVQKLDRVYRASVHAARTCSGEACRGSLHTACLHQNILDYFAADDVASGITPLPPVPRFLRADVRVFVQSNGHVRFSPRAVARIMHGLPSPAFPSSVWSSSHFWGRYLQTDFEQVMEAARIVMLTTLSGEDL